MRSVTVLALAVAAGAAPVAAGGPPLAKPDEIAIPEGERGIGYDDLQYAPELRRILVPAGRTGRLALIDPATRKVTAIGGFSASGSFRGGHGEGTTSATELEGGLVVATDRGSMRLRVVDARANKIVGSTKLAGPPDYVRSVPSTHELWVTEPARKQIEIFRVGGAPAATLSHVASIAVPDGPESLVIDAVRGRAYSHTWTDRSYAIDVGSRKIVSTWRNGCKQSRGIALDHRRGLLFAGCAEGRVTVVDLARNEVVSTARAGTDIDSIGYGATLGHLYVPGGGSADLSIFGVSSDGKLTLLGAAATAADAHTAAFDPMTSAVFVGAPAHGAVLVFHDPFPSSLK